MPSLDLNGIAFANLDILGNSAQTDFSRLTPEQIANLQNSLEQAHKSLLQSNSEENGFLNNQKDVERVINQEHEHLLEKKEKIDDSYESKKRLLELNESYRLKSADYTKLLMIFIFGLVILAFIVFLSKTVTFIPGLVYDILSIIVICATAYLGYIKYIDITRRDDLYYNELHMGQPPSNSPAQIAEMNKQNAKLGDLLGSVNLGACTGASCCDADGTEWDESSSMCVLQKPKTTRASTTHRASTTPRASTTTTISGFDTMANSAFEFDQYNPY